VKVAYVINSLEGGGACAPVPAVATALRRLGVELQVLALTRRDGRGYPGMAAAGLPVAVREGGERDHLAALRWLDGEVAEYAPDLIWTSLTRATLLGQRVGRRRGLPVISWQHAAFLKPANRLLLRWRQRDTLLWLADSNRVAELTRSRLGVEEERLAVWPLFAADASAPVARPWIPEQRLRIGSMGRLHPVKGYDVLLDALAILQNGSFGALPPFEVALAGCGGERDRLTAQAERLGLDDVTLCGFRQPRSFLADLHLYVQPSRSEGMCLAMHEAMLAGLPVVASAVGEMPYTILDNVTGSVVPPGDAGRLAQAIAGLLRNPAALAAIGGAGRQRVLGRFGAAAFNSMAVAIMDRISALRARATSAPHRSATLVPFDRPASRRSG
jgi:glycosyltransferase involved in cell wall biosynthesis